MSASSRARRPMALVTNACADSGAAASGQLAAAGYAVIGADYRAPPLRLRSRHLTSFHALGDMTPTDAAAPLLDLVQAARPGVFIPLGSRAVHAASRHAEALRRTTALLVPPVAAFEATRNKAVCGALCRQLGIPGPERYGPEEAARILRDGARQRILVVKPHVDVGAAVGVEYVSDLARFSRAVRACQTRHGGALIQEFIPGGVDAMRTVLLLFGRDSRLAAAFTARKVRQWPLSGGATAASVSTADAHLVATVLPYFTKLKWEGFAEAEFKFDHRDGRFKLIEINPRAPGYFRFPLVCGLPLARMAAQLAQCETATETIPFPGYAVGRTYVHPSLFMRTVAAQLRAGESLRSVLHVARADMRGSAPALGNMFADPLPMLARLLRTDPQPVVGADAACVADEAGMSRRPDAGQRLLWLDRLRHTARFAWNLRGQARFPFAPPAAIRRAQARRLRWMASYAYRTVPYYRETFDRLGLRPADFRSVDDLAHLPILERADIERDPQFFCSTAPAPGDLLKIRSGGSSGTARTVFSDPRGVFANAAHGERERSIWTALIGRSYGYRELVIGPPNGTVFKVQQYCRERAFYPRGVGIERAYRSLLDSPAEMLRHINAFKPDIINSYGSYLGILFRHLAATGEAFHRPTALTYTSDGLSESVRRLIGKQFHLPVFTTYQAVEAFKIGFECEEHRGVHLNEDLYPLRVVDGAGRTLPAGESGEVIVSNLVNGGTVLLNYRLGDIATRLPDPCPCGRSLPLLSYPQGRSDDLIELASGRIVHPQGIRNQFNDEELIWEYQVVQESATHFRVSLMAAPACDQAQTRQRITAKFARVLEEGCTVDVVFADSIDRTAGGKFRPVISRRVRESLAAQHATAD